MAEAADGGGDLRRRAGDAGVDEGQTVRVLAQVGMPDGEAQDIQARAQLDDVYTVTLNGPGRPRPGVCRGRSYWPPGAPVALAHTGWPPRVWPPGPPAATVRRFI